MPRLTQLLYRLAVTLPLLLLGESATAQAPPNAAAGREAMKKLSKMIGYWEGDATVTLGPNQVHKVRQYEHVQSKLDGNLLLIEGTGREKGTNGPGKTVFQAMAICNFDPISKSYKFHAFRDNGMSTIATAEVTDTGLIWGFEDGRGGKVRYTITLSEDTWSELGEYLIDGQPPRKIFEMKVKRIEEPTK